MQETPPTRQTMRASVMPPEPVVRALHRGGCLLCCGALHQSGGSRCCNVQRMQASSSGDVCGGCVAYLRSWTPPNLSSIGATNAMCKNATILCRELGLALPRAQPFSTVLCFSGSCFSARWKCGSGKATPGIPLDRRFSPMPVLRFSIKRSSASLLS